MSTNIGLVPCYVSAGSQWVSFAPQEANKKIYSHVILWSTVLVIQSSLNEIIFVDNSIHACGEQMDEV